MKKTINSLSVLIIGLILFSCSTSNDVAGNFGIQKRKYTKGFSISKKKQFNTGTSKFETEAIAINHTENSKKENINAIESKIFVKNNIEINTIKLSENLNTKTQTVSATQKYKQINLTTLKDVSSLNETFKPSKIIKSKIKKVFKKQSPASDDIIIYYLLAFFIPFLAVGLVTDWDVSQVVLNLLLTILCVIPGIIHAFIVVRDNY